MADLDTLEIVITSNATQADAALKALGETLKSISTACSSGAGLGTVASGLNRINRALAKITPSSSSALISLATALKDLSTAGAGASSFTTMVSSINKLPKALDKLTGMNMTQVANSIKNLANALQPLIQQLNQIGANNAAIQALQQLSRMKFHGSTGGGGGGGSNPLGNFGGLFQLGAITASIHHITRTMQVAAKGIAHVIEQANSYVEAVNLFTVALGNYAGEAEEYANLVSEKVGIDSGDWLKAEGTFMTLIEGFGVMEKRAYIMSQNLTQLGYDLSSFFNISVQDAMTKVQSGISGELEPLRRLGFDLSQTRLKAEALALGITKSFNAMTQAEKAQLRYHAIMTQVTTAQGDMARTLNSGGNQIRIFQAQITMAGRALGQIFIPMLNSVIPYAIAVVKAIRMIAESIANLFGYTLPEIDYSNVNHMGDVSEDVANNAGKTAKNTKKAAKEAKNLLASWDELNIIMQEANDNASGAGSGIGSAVGDQWTWDLPTYDFLGGLVQSRFETVFEGIRPQVEWVQEHIESILETLVIGAGYFALWRFSKQFLDGIQETMGLKQFIGGTALAAGTIVVSLGLNWFFDGRFVESGDIMQLLLGKFATVFGGFTAGRIISNLFGSTAGAVVPWATIGLSGIIDLIFTLGEIRNDGVTREAVITGITGGLATALGFGLTALKLGATLGAAGLIGGGALVLYTAVALVAGTIFAAQQNREELAGNINWGSIHLTQEEIKELAESLFSTETDYKIRISTVQSVRSDLEATYEALQEYSAKYNKESILLRFGVNTEDSMGAMLEALTGSAAGSWDGKSFTNDSLIGQLKKTLSGNLELFSVGIQAVGFVDEKGKPLSSETELVKSFTSNNTYLNKTVETIGTNLGKILSEGYKKGLDERKDELVDFYTNWLNDITQAAMKGEANANFRMAMSQIKMTDLDAESYEGIIQQYSDARDKLKSDYMDIAQGNQKALFTQAEILYANWENIVAGIEKGITSQKEADDAYNRYLEALNEANSYDVVGHANEQAARVLAEGEEKMRQAWTELFVSGYNPGEIGDDWFGEFFVDNWLTADSVRFDKDAEDAGKELDRQLYEMLAGLFVDQKDMELLKQSADMLGSTIFDLLPESLKTSIYDAVKQYVGGDDETVNKLFENMGSSYVKNLTTGLSQTAPLVKAGADARRAFEMGFSGGTGMNITLPPYKIPNIGMFAEGGFPHQGDAFIAREAGPELVGRIGRRTAVANNDQIVDGITTGVAQGQSEQNGLLRQQNEYLAELASKDFTPKFYPSMAMARTVKASEEMLRRSGG